MKQKGSLTVITGCMFSGKSTELTRLLGRQKIAKRSVQLFKPDIDVRFSATAVVTHDGVSLEATAVSVISPTEILRKFDPQTEVVGIDEAQFFGPEIVAVRKELTDRGIDVIAAGLKQDSQGEEFGSMAKLLIMANFITNLTAVCVVCGNDEATMTQWIGSPEDKSNQVVVGGSTQYFAVCHKHHRRI